MNKPTNGFIWAPKMSQNACCKIPYKGYEISIAMDDSCGVMPIYGRSDIRVFRDSDGKDITAEIFDHDQTVRAQADTLLIAFKMIDIIEQ